MGSHLHRQYHQLVILAAPPLLLLLLLRCSSSSTAALPTSAAGLGSFNTGADEEEHPAANYLASHHLQRENNGAVKMEGKMKIEVDDYPGTGANHNHDPKPPARV